MFGFDGYLEKVLKRGYRSSAVSPLLWLNALVSVPCLMASFLIPTEFRWAPFAIAALLIGYTIYKYNYLVNKDPKWVQSEKFQIESHKLDIVAKKGGRVLIAPVDLALSEEPKYLSQIESDESEDS